MNEIQRTNLPAEAILKVPHLNKGTAFSHEERQNLGLCGLLPVHVSSIEQQLIRRYNNFKGIKQDLGKVNFLQDVQKRNEVLFYRFCLEHCEEVLPYLYTPFVGDVSLDYSNLYAQNRGLFLNITQQDQITQIIRDYPSEISAIVVTDGSRVLGLGDVGVGGMSIPNGKLTLYSLFGAIHPQKTLPVILDVGTDNEKLLNDPLYIGLKQKRATGKAYYDFVDTFVQAVKERWPQVLLQWEDFQKPHAQNLLDLYQDEISSFNDDIQGTASVTLAALLAALKGAGLELKKQKICIFGAGGAGTGIADLIVQKLIQEGLSEKEACSLFYLVDRKGLIHTGHNEIDHHQMRFAKCIQEVRKWNTENIEQINLLDTLKHSKASVLIGVSGQKGAFTKQAIEQMALHHKKPIIFPLSNPNNYAEATPQDLFNWTQGACIAATGSPFGPVIFNNQSIDVTQCNNVYIFPGVGLGVIASKSRQVTNEMFIKAAEVLAEHAPFLKEASQPLFPPIEQLRALSEKIGVEVAKLAQKRGLSQKNSTEDPRKWIEEEVWYPSYQRLIRG